MKEVKNITLDGDGNLLGLTSAPRSEISHSVTSFDKVSVNGNLERLIKTCNSSENQKLKEIGKNLTRLLDGTIKQGNNTSTRKAFKTVNLNFKEP